MRGGWNCFRIMSADRLVLIKVSDSFIKKNVVRIHYLWTCNFFCCYAAKLGNICKIWGPQSSVDAVPDLFRSNVYLVNRYPSLDLRKWKSILLKNISNFLPVERESCPRRHESWKPVLFHSCYKEWGKFKLLSHNYITVFSSYSEMVQKTQKRMSCLDLSKNK